MEKITKEELLEKLGRIPLSDDELEKIAGGDTTCIPLLSDDMTAFQECVRDLASR